MKKIQRKRKIRAINANGNQTNEEIMLSQFDPNGSYTGIPTSLSEDQTPTQDADDL